ncbi:MAG: DNA mismatch repair protein MutT, partial [Acutalibacteraceae bacterium]
EETGLTIRHPVLCGVKDWENEDKSRYIILFFKTDKFDGQLTSSSEGDVFWVEKDELPHYSLAPDFADMYPIFENDQLSEFFYRQTDGEIV